MYKRQDKLERHWESLRLELFHSRELGLHVRQDLQAPSPQSDFTLDDALELYLSLKGGGRRKTFFQVAHRAITYLKETALAAEITALTFSDASTFREHLFSKGLILDNSLDNSQVPRSQGHVPRPLNFGSGLLMACANQLWVLFEGVGDEADRLTCAR